MDYEPGMAFYKGKQKTPGVLDKIKSGVRARVDEKVADLNERIEHPQQWREKQHNLKMTTDGQRVKELELEAKIARLNASKARSQNTVSRYTGPAGGMGGGGDLFDLGVGGGMGGGGSGALFDLGVGGSSGGGGGALFDLGLGGSATKKKRANPKKKKNSGGGVHIHINK